MKKFVLMMSAAILLTTNIIVDSQATDIVSGNSCQDDSSYSVNCKWRLTDEGVLFVERVNLSSPASIRGNYGWPSWTSYVDQINTVVFDGVEANDEYGMGSFLHGTIEGQTTAPVVVLNDAGIDETWRESWNGWGYDNLAIITCKGGGVQSCLISNGLVGCPSGQVLQEGECVASCGSSFKLNDGECDRIRYTPAEAAQYLKDTDNEIIMTFKVNR